ncbi:NADPH oxidase 5-like [Paramacrobiotus metropolitanus]|uniref:NADPH oxidase 5-like n=1 Tax=Paramacrobiotus metropolitanus TaxID=2943436 RepID=UPI0024462997|nr:NADPH oxidase 5-like [Paramacrobiotus metropolitanus]XP_055337531.1 NADPH oxidase 5-like [Paramacrobiotus metropolitanus]
MAAMRLPEAVSSAPHPVPPRTLSTIFQSYDYDYDGLLSRHDLFKAIVKQATDYQLDISPEKAMQLVHAVFDAAAIPADGMLGKDDFQALMKDYLPHNDANAGIHITCSPGTTVTPPSNPGNRVDTFAWKSKPESVMRSVKLKLIPYKNEIIVLSVYILFCVLLFFIGSAVAYLEDPESVHGMYAYLVAKGFGMILDINCSIIILPILHWTMTFVRKTGLGSFLPLDALPKFHITCAICIGIAGACHTVAHIVNFAEMIEMNPKDSPSLSEYLFVPRHDVPGLVQGLASVTGWILILIFVAVVLFSLPIVRQTQHFQLFYWFHKLVYVFWLILILHARNFWKYFCFFGVLLIVEKLRKYYIVGKKNSSAEIIHATLLPSQVMHLTIKRPENFAHNPGDFVFVKIPAVARHEWHPFTISSAPELDDNIWLHIRVVGNWTKALYTHLKRQKKRRPVLISQQSLQNLRTNVLSDPTAIAILRKLSVNHFPKFEENNYANAQHEASITKSNTVSSFPLATPIPVFIDGPYGSSTAAIFHTEHAVLIGSGIGITPMAAILGSIVHHFRRNRMKCPHCDKDVPFINNDLSMCNRLATKLKKVDFIWVCRDQMSIQWFIDLLKEWEHEQTTLETVYNTNEDFVTAQIYITSGPKKTSLSTAGLSLGMNLHYQQTRTDILTGLKSQTRTGRPKWNDVFGSIAKSQKGQVRVFFCGSRQLSREIRQQCALNKFDFSWENF